MNKLAINVSITLIRYRRNDARFSLNAGARTLAQVHYRRATIAQVKCPFSYTSFRPPDILKYARSRQDMYHNPFKNNTQTLMKRHVATPSLHSKNTLKTITDTLLWADADESAASDNMHVKHSRSSGMSNLPGHNSTTRSPMRQRPPHLRLLPLPHRTLSRLSHALLPRPQPTRRPSFRLAHRRV